MSTALSPVRPPSHRVARFIYRMFWLAITPALGVYLRRRSRRGKEDLSRLQERYGLPSRQRPSGDVIWVHGASVGESLSALPVIEQLLRDRPDISIVVTTGTVTSAQILSERLPAGAFHQFVPLDHPSYVRRFLDHWKPSAVLWLESEFWPNLIVEATKRRIPMALINARVSDASYNSWQRNRWAIEPILQGFRLCLAQDDDVARKLKSLGATNVITIGNLKYGAAALPVRQDHFDDLKAAIASRPVWLAAQTIFPEEESVIRVHRKLVAEMPDLLTIIAPRHPERGSVLAETIRSENLELALRSNNEKIEANTQIYLADTMGELGLLFRLTDIVFLGRSLAEDGGGSNLLEPARLSCAILQGPHTHNFTEVTDRFATAGAFVLVKDETALAYDVARLFSDPAYRGDLTTRAQMVADEAAGVLGNVVQAVMPLLPQNNGQIKNART